MMVAAKVRTQDFGMVNVGGSLSVSVSPGLVALGVGSEACLQNPERRFGVGRDVAVDSVDAVW